jgi:nucleoside-diphosphate-sugar epimerase
MRLTPMEGTMRCLVTGAAGFIGSHLVEGLVADGHVVIGVDSYDEYYERAYKETNLARLGKLQRFEFQERDVMELAPADLEKIEAVFHLAARPGVRASWGAGFELYVRNNILVTHHLLDSLVEARPAAFGKLVIASSSSVYGDALRLPTAEDTCPNPISPYGVTKLTCEKLCTSYRRAFGIPIVMLRYFTVYGPRQRPDMAFHRFIAAALAGRQITVNGDGHQSRDFTYVDDIVDGTIRASKCQADLATFNLGNDRSASVHEVLDLLSDLLDCRLQIIHGPAQPGDTRNTRADITTARRDLGFAPVTSLRQGLLRQIQSFSQD